MLPLLAACLLAYAAEAGATIQGVVRAAGAREPIPFASVTIRALERTVQTDAHGFFVLSAVPAGVWVVEANALGYAGQALTVGTADNVTARVEFELPLRPVQLPGVAVRTDAPVAQDHGASLDAGPGPARLSAAALKTLPGIAEPDIVRALQQLPAVSEISDFSTALYVRGGAADQTLLELDGLPLFNPYHIGGLMSAVPTDVVSTVDVWTGALPARMGDRLSGAVVINTREGGKDRLRTSGGVGLVSTNVTVDGPLHAGRGSFLLFGRRTYIDAITGIGYGLGVFEVTVPYGFTDVYGKVTHRIGPLGSISLSGYWDSETMTPPERRLPVLDDFGEFNWRSRLTSVSYRQPIGGAMLLEARVGYTAFKGGFGSWEITERLVCRNPSCNPLEEVVDTTILMLGRANTRDVVVGADLSWFRKRHTLRSGLRHDGYRFDYKLSTREFDKDYLPDFVRRSSFSNIAAYVEDEWRPGERWAVRAGLRLLAAGSLGTAWLPRLGARWQATPSLAFTAGGGRYAQALRSLKDDEASFSSFVAYDLLTPQPDEPGLARGSDIVLGAEFTDRTTRVRVEAFRKTQEALVFAAETDAPFDARPLTLDEYRIGSGSSRGLELSVRAQAGRFAFGLGYALSGAERQAGTDAFPPRFERRHQLDLSNDYQWGAAGLLNARLVLASGQPFTPGVALAQPLRHDPVKQRWEYAYDVIVTGDHNSARLPRYVRLDIAARRSYQRRWFGRDGVITPYLQIVNVLNNRNALLPEFKQYGRPRIEYWPQFPFLPTFGLEWRF